MPFIGKALVELREREQLSQRELATLLGVSNGIISFWENNEKTPRVDSLDDLYNFARKRGYHDIVFYEPPSPKR